VAFHGALSRAEFAAGPFSEADLFRLVPYENAIGVAWLDREDLIAITSEQLSQRDSYAYCGIWGLRVALDTTGRVVSIHLPDGDPLAPGTRIPVAFNSYTLAGGGGRFPVLRQRVRKPEAKLTPVGLDTRQAVRDLFAKAAYTPATTRWVRSDKKRSSP